MEHDDRKEVPCNDPECPPDCTKVNASPISEERLSNRRWGRWDKFCRLQKESAPAVAVDTLCEQVRADGLREGVLLACKAVCALCTRDIKAEPYGESDGVHEVNTWGHCLGGDGDWEQCDAATIRDAALAAGIKLEGEK